MFMRRYEIYLIENRVNGKFYIGRTTVGIDQRWSGHKNKALCKRESDKNNPYNRGYLQRSIRKYGVENFSIRKIDEALNFEHMVWLEGFYIKYYNSNNPKYGYNLTIDSHGDGLEFVSDETSKKISNSIHNYKVRGVVWDKDREKWTLGFNCKKKNIKITKRFDDEVEAKESRDKLSILVYGAETGLYFPEKLEDYLLEDLEEFLKEISKKRDASSNYNGVCKSGKYCSARILVKNKNLYIGCYNSEVEAAKVYDKVACFLKYKKEDLNFPDLVTSHCAKDGEDIFKTYSDPNKKRQMKKQKISKYNGVGKFSKNWWSSEVVINKTKYRDKYGSEVEAAEAHDYYRVKFDSKLESLNFPEKIEKYRRWVLSGDDFWENKKKRALEIPKPPSPLRGIPLKESTKEKLRIAAKKRHRDSKKRIREEA